jgi:hypothetical protein
MLVHDMRGDVLRRGADAARRKLGAGPVEKDTERREDEGVLEGRVRRRAGAAEIDPLHSVFLFMSSNAVLLDLYG